MKNMSAGLSAMKLISRLVAALLAVAVSAGFLGATLGCSGGPAVLPPPSSDSSPQKGVIHYIDDHLGSAHLITDSKGNVLREENRYPYGLDWRVDGADATTADYVYTGKEYDAETGLVYFGGRYYSPEMGRWTTPDPMFLEEVASIIKRPLEANLYAYVRNNPINYIDPLGLRILKLTQEQEAIVAPALQRSVYIVDKTTDLLATRDDVAGPQLTMWFGNNSTETKLCVSTNLNRMEDTLKQIEVKNFRFDDETVFVSYVNPRNSSKIYVGRSFFDAPDEGLNSKPGAFVHEASHFRNTVGTKDYYYGIEDALGLAHSDSEKAKMNADNYEYFVESMTNEQ
jgi:RHS repeat-associated protein